MKKIIYISLLLIFSVVSYAGGNPEYVKFPAEYKSEFTHYETVNRVGKPQVVDLYGNNIAINTTAGASGAIIVMEIYKARLDEDGKPITGKNGVYEKGKFAAIAVMEKKSDWDNNFDANSRTGDWGYAIYNTDESIKDNNLDCAGCHRPESENDYLFSRASLLEKNK